MSSALRRISQLPKSIKFLRSVIDTTANIVADASMSIFLADAEVNIESLTGIHTVVESTETPTTSNYSSGPLVRDMGRRVTVKSTADGNPLRQVWIQVQAVNGPDSEGVPDDYRTTGSFWVCTWADSGDDVEVKWVRTG